jgi:hypothetical protein
MPMRQCEVLAWAGCANRYMAPDTQRNTRHVDGMIQAGLRQTGDRHVGISHGLDPFAAEHFHDPVEGGKYVIQF